MQRYHEEQSARSKGARLSPLDFLLTVDNSSFLLTVRTFLLTVLASLLTIGAFLLTMGECA